VQETRSAASRIVAVNAIVCDGFIMSDLCWALHGLTIESMNRPYVEQLSFSGEVDNSTPFPARSSGFLSRHLSQAAHNHPCASRSQFPSSGLIRPTINPLRRGQSAARGQTQSRPFQAEEGW